MTNNDSCVPTGDTVARACLRVTQYDVSGASPTMPQNFGIFSPGSYLYYATVSGDRAVVTCGDQRSPKLLSSSSRDRP